jgi:hypothetical protein
MLQVLDNYNEQYYLTNFSPHLSSLFTVFS